MRYGIVFFSVVIAGSLSGCATTSRENSDAEVAAAKLVLGQICDTLGDAYPTGAANFEMGTLDDGDAVLLAEINRKPVGAAFWVQGSTVYAVNDAARALNDSLPPAPTDVTEKRVRKVVH